MISPNPPPHQEPTVCRRGLATRRSRDEGWRRVATKDEAGVDQGKDGQDDGLGESYYTPICRGAAAMSERNRVTFAGEADAREAGYRRAWDCW
jgi:hypothetical protein